ILQDPKPLLERVMGEEDDRFGHRLALAARCLPEISSGMQASCRALVDRIAAQAFAAWRDAGTPEVAWLTRARRTLPDLARAGARIDGLRLLDWIGLKLESEDGEEQRNALEAVVAVGTPSASPPILARLSSLLHAGDAAVR